MRTISTAVTAALACLALGASAAGCTDGSTTKELSAEQLLDKANATMRGLTSVTIAASTKTARGGYSSRLRTDLKGRCLFKTTYATGAVLEQIRIDGTDYIRPNLAYVEQWKFGVVGKNTAGKERRFWTRRPAHDAEPGDGLTDCTHPFASFGVAKKGEPAKVDGSPAITLVVTDKADKEGSFTFYVAAEGEPYILKVVYEGATYHSTTSFSAFDEPLDVRPPAKTDVLRKGGVD